MGAGVVTPYWSNGVIDLYQTDARDLPLPDQSIHCVVTSPPYFGLRVYQDNDDRGIGLETSIEAYVTNLVDVFREVRRVLRDDGVLWLNLGDSYGANGRDGGARGGGDKQTTNPGSLSNDDQRNSYRDGDRLGIPERVVMALQADGWVWRDTIIWAKKSAMPESLAGWRWERCKVKTGREAADWNKTPKGWDTGEGSHNQLSGNFRKEGEREATVAVFEDCPGCPKCEGKDGLVLRKGSWRTTSAHEYIYMLTKGIGYYADGEAVKTAAAEVSIKRMKYGLNTANRPGKQDVHVEQMGDRWLTNGGANRRSVWNDISPEPYGGAHFATFPSDLPRICIQASTSEKGVCPECGSQWARVVKHKNMEIDRTDWGDQAGNCLASSGTMVEPASTQTTGWRPTCDCQEEVMEGESRVLTMRPYPPVPATVLDPFAGTATACLAAQKLGRRAVGVDISDAYLKQAVKRLTSVTLPLLPAPEPGN